MSTRNTAIGRSMIPNYYIQEPQKESFNNSSNNSGLFQRSKRVEVPTMNEDPLKDPLNVVRQSKVYDTEVYYSIATLVLIIIMFALTPLWIIFIKKYQWHWVYSMVELDPPVSISQPINSNLTSTTTIPEVKTINTTGSGIDINKPYVVPTSVLREYSKVFDT